MSKSCFVIMPFGKDKDKQSFYTSVYESIICPAAAKCHYDVNRVDTKPSNVGNITKNIINDLVYSDIVIADLTEGNANVFYELGIRHALHKCSTILIIQEGYDIPFDLKQHVAVFYSTDIRGIQTAIQGIANAIEKSEKARENDADNPVHEYIPSLSLTLSMDGEEDLRNIIKKLTEELKVYKDITGKYGISPNKEIEIEEDIEKSLIEADELVEIGGISAILELRDAVSNSNLEKFKQLLKTILKSKLLASENYIEISDMCKNMGLIPHRIIVLNEGYKLFPRNTTIAGLLADAYSDHPQLQQKQKGREFIEKFMNIEYEDKLPVASRLTQDDSALLMGLFNTYIGQADWEAIISFCNSASKYNLDSLIIMRNKVRALIEMGNYTTAESELLDMINEYPEDDSLQTLLSSLYHKTGDYSKALSARENALFIDPQDTTHYLNLVIDILNRGFIHNNQGEIIGPLDQRKRLVEVLSIMNYILKIDSSPSARMQISQLLAKRNANREATEALMTGQITIQEKSLELEYLLAKIENIPQLY